MGSMNINFGSGKGTIYSNQNSENSLYSLLKGNHGNSDSTGVRVSGTGTNSKNGSISLGSTNPLFQKNSIFNSGMNGQGAASSLFSGFTRSKNSSIVNSINNRTNKLSSISTLKEQNPILWAFLHPAEAKAEGIGKSSEIELLEESLKENGLGYDYKKVSKEIKESKDSGSATKAVSTAKRTLSELKKKIRESSEDENIDPYEVQAALVHAEKMVHIAEKHLKNVKQEEIAERNQKGGEFIDLGLKDNLESVKDSAISPEEEKKKEEAVDESIREDVKAFMASVGYSFDTDGNIISSKGKALNGISPEQYERAYLKGISSNVDAISLSEISSNMTGVSDAAALSRNTYDEFIFSSAQSGSSDDISSMMNDLGISEDALPDFLDDLTTPNLYGMEPNEVKMLKLKHRLKESIAIAKADAEYLKVVFERMNDMKSGAAAGSGSSAGSGSNAANFSGAASGFDAVSFPSGEVVSNVGAVPADSGMVSGSSGIDVSI